MLYIFRLFSIVTKMSNKQLKFIDFCKLCDKISSSKDKKGEILRKFISDFRNAKVMSGNYYFNNIQYCCQANIILC